MSNESQQVALFDEEELCPWSAEWQNMPEFSLLDLSPRFSVVVNFTCASDLEAFAALLQQPISTDTGRQTKSSRLEQRLQRRPDVIVPTGVNNFGMVLEERVSSTWRPLQVDR